MHNQQIIVLNANINDKTLSVDIISHNSCKHEANKTKTIVDKRT